MIKSIEIKNFKSIKGKFFPLRNLNVLVGLNGMGKSSFIQMLLAIRQSSNIFGGYLNLNDTSLLKLGNTKDVLYQYSKNECLEFDLKFDGNNQLNLKFKYEPEADYFNAVDINRDDFGFDKSKFSKQTLFSNNFQYLNANRKEPTSVNSKNFSTVVNNKNIGINGEFTPHFIEVFGSEDVLFDNIVHKDSKREDSLTGKFFVNKLLLNQINLWMGEISPNVKVRTTSISSDYILLEYEYNQPNFGTTNKFKPENVGFGISYGLPVVVALLTARPGQLIIVENPESHIHPKGQAELGKLIAKVAMNDVQLIIETHSDHILNGIRVAIKENELSKDKAILFYFEKEVTESEQFSKITNIEIDKNGELSEYPKHMMDEWSNQLLKLL